MFWIKFDALRPSLSQQYIFTDNDNNLARYSYDDFFNLAMYEGEIYKTRNLKNMSMMQMYPDPDDMKHAQDSIEKRLRNYDKNLWVPTREELAAIAEAQAAAADSTEISTRDNEPAKEVKSSRGKSSRGKKETSTEKTKKKKQPKVKESKPKNSSSSANRSVRRRK